MVHIFILDAAASVCLEQEGSASIFDFIKYKKSWRRTGGRHAWKEKSLRGGCSCYLSILRVVKLH